MTSRNQGMNWCRPATRLAIYLRDGMACVYCDAGVENCERLTLDHLKPHSRGGSNDPTNLVTCCVRCNSSRGVRSVTAFCKAVAEYRGDESTARSILTFVRNTSRRTLPRDAARALLARRGTVAGALLAEML